MGFAFGFQGPAMSTMTPTDINPEDADAFDKGVLAGQDAAIEGLVLAEPCVVLNSEGPTLPHMAIEGAEAASALVAFAAKHLIMGLTEGLVMLFTLSITLQTTFDDPDVAVAQQASSLATLLQQMGITDPMQLFLGGAVDVQQTNCEVQLTPIFRTLQAAIDAARAVGRPQWLVISWRTDQSGGMKLEDFLSN